MLNVFGVKTQSDFINQVFLLLVFDVYVHVKVQVCLSMYDLLVDTRHERVKIR